MTKNKTRINEFPSKTGTSSHPVIKDGIENFDDYEGMRTKNIFIFYENPGGLYSFIKNLVLWARSETIGSAGNRLKRNPGVRIQNSE